MVLLFYLQNLTTKDLNFLLWIDLKLFKWRIELNSPITTKSAGCPCLLL